MLCRYMIEESLEEKRLTTVEWRRLEKREALKRGGDLRCFIVPFASVILACRSNWNGCINVSLCSAWVCSVTVICNPVVLWCFAIQQLRCAVELLRPDDCCLDQAEPGPSAHAVLSHRWSQWGASADLYCNEPTKPAARKIRSKI